MNKKIEIGDTVYLLKYDNYIKSIVDAKVKDGNKYYYKISGDSSWYTRDRLATSEKEAKDCIMNQ